MNRFALYLAGVSALATAWVVFRNRMAVDPSRKRIPVQQAAAMLQQAWADHHTTA